MKFPRIFMFFAIPLVLAIFLLPGRSSAYMDLSVSGLKLGEGSGPGSFVVERVYDDSPAEDAGIVAGEMLVEVDHMSLSDKSPAEVENSLSMRLGEGRSSVLTLVGPSGRAIAWLKPAMYSLEQRKTLDFCQKILWQKRTSDLYWQQAGKLFSDGIAGNMQGEEFADRMSTSLQGINGCRMAISDIAIPSGLNGKTLSMCSDVRSAYVDTQFLRYDAGAKMKDYVMARRENKIMLQKRWDKIDPAEKRADKKERLGGLILERLLMSVGYEGKSGSLELR